jgi:hypothetical protein
MANKSQFYHAPAYSTLPSNMPLCVTADTYTDTCMGIPIEPLETLSVPNAVINADVIRHDPLQVHSIMCEIFRDVYKSHGGGHSESLYQKAVVRAAYLKGLPVMMEREIYTDRGHGSFHVGRVDVEVAGSCLYELKIGKPKIVADTTQLKRYLGAYDNNGESIQIASLVYFGPSLHVHDVRQKTLKM